MMRATIVDTLLLLAVDVASAAEPQFKPAGERRFSGATATLKRQREYAQRRLLRAAESVDRTCTPSRESMLANITGRARHRAELIARNMSRQERLAAAH